MRAVYLAILAIFLSAFHVCAQSDNVTLLAQSVDGKTVKLFWFIKTWNSSITGFDVRRREGNQPWAKLNSAPIMPGVWSRKKLAPSGTNMYDESLLKPKMFRLLKSRTLADNEPTKYLTKLTNDPHELPALTREMEEDYDVAMMAGFGYIDHTLTHPAVYQYALFIQGTDKMLAKVTWTYGDKPDLDVVQELTSKANSDRGIKVIWTADTAKIRQARVVGFNIYREGIRLNESRIAPEDMSDPSAFVWLDKYVNSAVPTKYSIAAESIFGIEGIIRSYAYDPAEHPKEYKKTEVTEIASIGFYFKDGTSVKWSFPREYERFIKGFYVEKANMPGGYNVVSGLIDPGIRAFTDKTQSQVNGYVKMRVKALYNDHTMVPGADRLYCYLPVADPPAPQNLKVKSVSGDRSVTAYFSWDPPIAGDSITDFYRVYAWDNRGNKYVPITDKPVRGNSYTYSITHGTAGVRMFYVTAVTRQNSESSNSDTVSVQTPTLEMPVPTLKRVTADNSNRATIEWEYPEVVDLKGFRVIQNGKVVAAETELKKGTHSYVTGKLEEGASYEFSLSAVSDNGLVSEISPAVHVVVAETSRK